MKTNLKIFSRIFSVRAPQNIRLRNNCKMLQTLQTQHVGLTKFIHNFLICRYDTADYLLEHTTIQAILNKLIRLQCLSICRV